WFVLCSVLYLMLSRHARSPLFPYTTLFRSLSGAEARVPEVVSLYNESREMFAPGGFAVARLALDSRDSWSLTLDNGVEVVVGSQEARLRLKRFARVLPQLLARSQQPLQRADLRYTHG